jgi:hypothetical protein
VSIGDWTEQQLEAFVRSRLNLPENLRSKLAGSLLKVAGGADLRVSLGTVSLVFSASFAESATVAHELGAAPLYVFVSSVEVAGAGSVIGFEADRAARTDTTFEVIGRQQDGANITGTFELDWLVIG